MGVNTSLEEKTRLMGAALVTGFAGGLFLRVGVDPYGTPLEAIFEVLSDLGLPSYVGSIARVIISILSIASMLITLKRVYRAGGILGLIAVGLAFVSGLIVLDATQVGGFLLVGAAILGIIAVKIFHNDQS